MIIDLVECTSNYWEFVRQLRTDERVIDGFIETKPITPEQQVTYMNNNAKYHRIALVDGKPAGYVGVIDDDIRVCTHPNFQGMGIGKFMIHQAINIWPNAYAKVKHDNLASNRLFISCGFENTSSDKNFLYYKVTN